MALLYVPHKYTALFLLFKNVPFMRIKIHNSSYKVPNTNEGKFVKVSIELKVFFNILSPDMDDQRWKNLV